MSLDIFALILQSHHQSAKYRPVLENETNISVLLNDFGQLRVNFFAVGALVIKILNNADSITDVLADPDYALTEAQKLGGYRTMLGVILNPPCSSFSQ
jgi:hypothetical protein